VRKGARVTPVFGLRLALDFLGLGLFLFGFSYWWLGNGAHEAAGTAFFALLVAHNVFNRRWWARAATRAPTPRTLADTTVTLSLATAMAALLGTSVLISQTLSPWLSAFGGFTVRQIHTLAAYWALVIAAVHLGLRWPMLMGLARAALGLRGRSRARSWLLRLAALAVAVLGAWSSARLGLGGKLAMQVSLDWWNFEESVAGFFLHAVAIVGLFAAATHYAVKLGRRLGGTGARRLGQAR